MNDRTDEKEEKKRTKKKNWCEKRGGRERTA